MRYLTSVFPRKPIFYGWVIVAVAVASQVAGIPGQASFLTVFIDPLSNEFGWSRTFLSTASSLGVLISAGLVSLAGPILDRHGPRYLILIIGIGMSLGCLGVALSNSQAGFLLSYLVVRSFGAGVLVLTCTTAVSNWFVKKRGRAMSLTSLGFPIGIAIAVPLSQLLMSYVDWRTLWFLFAGLAACILIPGSFLLYRRPEDRGLLPDGQPLPSTAADNTPTAPAQSSVPEYNWKPRDAIKTPTFWIIAISMGIFSIAASGVTLHQMPFMLDRGMSPSAAAAMVGMYAVFSGVGAILGGFLADRIPVSIGLSCSFVSVAVSLMGFMLLPLPYGPLAYAVFFGYALGSKSSLEPVAWASYYGRLSLGTIRGVALPIEMLGLSMGPILGGAMYDYLGGYVPMFVGLITASIVCAIAIIMARAPKRQLGQR